MYNLILYCKSYKGDVQILKKLKSSIEKYNKDNIPFYISCPKEDKQLFEDTNYSLKDVREKKLVKPVALTLLPAEIKMIESTKKRKDFFIQIVLPLILQENNNIKLDRKRLFSIINKSNNTDLEKKWLKKNINNMEYHQEIYQL